MSEHNCDGWDSCPNPAHRKPTLTGFLLARIAEDEAGARMAPREWWSTRLLAECEAKRRIVDLHRPSTDHGENFNPYCVGCWEEGGEDGAPSFPCRTARYLALPYADHEDFREEWRP